ncbi:MoxR family ATPase [Tumidithrix elongata RA019]|uniref:MoxR family ATPase n=1 Tax=Tumidithrix elongata BACA0141 TaxID=2716417 RepID=A0AAW9Q225_9CYAN|nr:MoxR family ATPase [Tumidithrix elongata RA019]
MTIEKPHFYNDRNIIPNIPHKDSPKMREPYVADDELIQAVNLAILLERPLLIEGEAGCGKTCLAKAVAYELGYPFYRWDVQSTAKVRDGLYTYDAVLRLHDVQTRSVDVEKKRDPSKSGDYLGYGPLGKAFVSDRPAVVLIDEIDKADLDFPNDLLGVLEDWKFSIPETKAEISAKHKPIVIITSNKEKGNLPAPFLRRCLYFYLEFPKTTEALEKIVNEHYRMDKKNPARPPNPELVKVSVDGFLKIRENQSLYKKPGTSEFLDWLKSLQFYLTEANQLKEQLQSSETVPYREVLFKHRNDWLKYRPAQ